MNTAHEKIVVININAFIVCSFVSHFVVIAINKETKFGTKTKILTISFARGGRG